MKWVLYLFAGLGGLVIIAVVVLLAMGSRRDAGRYETSIEIGRPAPVVFAWVTEPQRVKSWVGWVIEIRPLTPQLSGAGSRELWVMEDRNNNNQRMDIEADIVRHDADRLRVARLTVPDMFSGTVTYELQPLDDRRTQLTYRSDFEYQHWLANLLKPVINRSARQKTVEDLARLKQLAEAE